MNQQTQLALQQNSLFENVNFDSLDLSPISGRMRTLSGGEILYRSGDKSDALYLIVNGEVNLLKSKNGKRTKSFVFEDKEFFGAKELFENVDRYSTTVSLMDTYVIELSKEEIDHLIDQNEVIQKNINDHNQKISFDYLDDQKINEAFQLDDYEDDEESELLEDFVLENDIDDFINKIDQQEDAIIENLNDFDDDNFSNSDLKSEKITDNKKKSKTQLRKDMDYVELKEARKRASGQNISGSLTSDQFELIVKALRLVNANVKLDDVLTNIVDVAIDLTNADRGTLYLVDKLRDEIWSTVLIGDEIEEIRLKVGQGLAGWVAKTGEEVNIEDVKLDERFDRSVDEATGYTTKNMLVYPIKDRNEQVVGVLQLLNSLSGAFSDQDSMFLNAISLNAAFALNNASVVEELVEGEREYSLGRIGNFLAHDIKKPILISKRYAEHLIKKDLPIDAKQILNLMLEQLDQVSSQVATAADYTEGTTILRKQPLNLNDTLHEFAINVHNLLKTNDCKVEYSFDGDVDIYVDKKEFYQCYYNVVKNACEALEEGGIIAITTEVKGDNIDIYFDDKGEGIEKSDLKNVFDPLWSKNKANHSGLGLSISKKIIEDHQGAISIESEKNLGTVVKISLPIH